MRIVLSVFAIGLASLSLFGQTRNPYEIPQTITWVTINWSAKETVTIKLPSGPEYSSTTKNLMVTVLLPDNQTKTVTGEQILALLVK